jgi:putative component of membrane protein insertase Oxa1/YidC/SpoIIIJ protein YidD
MRSIAALYLVVIFLLVSCAHPVGTEGESVYSFNPLRAMIDFYQGPLNHCSAVRSGECPMYPSCSEYGKEAFDKHGFFIGGMIASDRLMRCGRDEVRLAPKIYVDGKLKFYDPLENNTFWWDKAIRSADYADQR